MLEFYLLPVLGTWAPLTLQNPVLGLFRISVSETQSGRGIFGLVPSSETRLHAHI